MGDVKVAVVDSGFTTSLSVTEDSTVGQLRQQISDWKSIPLEYMTLAVDGEALGDDSATVSAVPKLLNSTVHVTDATPADESTAHPVGEAKDGFSVFVATSVSGNKRLFGVTGETTVLELKQALHSWRGIEPAHQKIHFGQADLADDVKLGDREINDREVLTLVYAPAEDGKEAAAVVSEDEAAKEAEKKKRHEEEAAEAKKAAEAAAAQEKQAAQKAKAEMQEREKKAAAEKVAASKKVSSPPPKATSPPPKNVMVVGNNKDVDFSDEALKKAQVAVGDAKDPHNWVAYGFVGKSNKLEVAGTGESGLSELVGALADDRVMFIILKVVGADVHQALTSNRDKFIVINWIGKSVPVMQRAKVSIQSKCFASWVTGVAIAGSFDISSKDDLTMEAMAKRLLAAGGAHKPTKYVFGPGQEIDIRAWTKA